MGEFSHIIDGMTWSFSRIGSFLQCPYAWVSSYIYGEEKRRLFFSDFGSFMHDILRRYFSNELSAEELPYTYLTEFSENVSGNAPSLKVISDRFEDGLSYLRSPVSGLAELKNRKILGVEQKFVLSVNDIPFVGIIDLTSEDGGDLVVTDHKSSQIKPPSGRKKPTLYDTERQEKARQLYLYAAAVHSQTGRWPDRLEFNCFRVPEIVQIPFDEKEKDDAIRWASSRVAEITECSDFTPKVDYFHCKYICDLAECPYRELL